MGINPKWLEERMVRLAAKPKPEEEKPVAKKAVEDQAPATKPVEKSEPPAKPEDDAKAVTAKPEDNAKAVTAKPNAPISPAAKIVPELGITGTNNWDGRIHAETNTKLQWEKAYGSPGSTQWGEWEKLERTDHQVAGALNLLCAPIRDADIEIAIPEVDPAPVGENGQPGDPENPDLPSDDGVEDAGSVPTPPADPASSSPEVDDPEKKLADDLAGKFAGSKKPIPPTKPGASKEKSGKVAGLFADKLAGKKGAPKVDENGEEVVDQVVDPQTAEYQKIASFVEDNLKEWIEPGWPMLLEQIVRYGLGYGFALHEVIWDTRDDPRVPGGTAFYVKKLAQRLPNSIRTDGWIEEDGELKTILQSGMFVDPKTKIKSWNARIELPADKVLLATWNRSGNNYQGFSAFRPAWYMGQLRADLLRILAIGHQRESCGVPIAVMDKDVSLTKEQREALQLLLENVVFHENAGFQLPPGVDVKWIFSPGANKGNIIETWRALGLAILELVQVQQMALGTGDTGSRAVGEFHDGTKNAFVKGIRSWIEAAFNGIGSQPYTGLIRKLVDLNFGPQKAYPKLKLIVQKSEIDPSVFATAVKTMVDAGGITLTEGDENDIRERLGMAPIDPVERQALQAVKQAEKAAQFEAMKQGGFGGGKPGAPPDGDEGPPKKFHSLKELLSLE